MDKYLKIEYREGFGAVFFWNNQEVVFPDAINQANKELKQKDERILELEEKLANRGNVLLNVDDKRISLESQLKQKDEIIEKLKEGLGFYADEESWTGENPTWSKQIIIVGDMERMVPTENLKLVLDKGGKLARQVIKEVKEMENIN